MTIRKRLEQYYKDKNYTQKTFADSANLSKTTINNIVLGVSKPSYAIIEAIANGHKDLDLRWWLIGEKSKILNFNFSDKVEESPPQYGNIIREVTVYIERECSATGGRCYFEQLREANEKILELEKKLKEK